MVAWNTNNGGIAVVAGAYAMGQGGDHAPP